VNSQNFGVAKSKAKCIELSKYKYFAFLDSDDQLTENALSKIFETINKFPDQALYFTDHIICDQDMNEIEKQIKKQIENNNKYFFNLNGEISHFAIVNRFFYNKTIGINSNLYKAIDQDLYLKLYDVGGVFYLNILAYKYRIHNQGISTNHNALRALYWHYIVIFQTCERRKLDSAKIFEENFVFRTQYRELQNSYLKLNAYSIFSKLRHWFFKQ
jgi:glycosyltransferase involved in cell wall biosynthesis